MKNTKIFKFGGASVKNSDAVRNVATIISQFSDFNLLVVISAMGKTTNKLEELAFAFWNNQQDEKVKIIKELKNFHFEIAQELVSDTKHHLFSNLDDLIIELECLVEKKYPNASFDEIYDGIVSYGELISTRIVSDFLNFSEIKNKWVDARNFIQTDNTYREAKVKWAETEDTIQRILKPYLERNIVITQGFIGRDEQNNTTTLGREGSDYSAAIFAYCLQAQDLTIWKDVAGVMNADPKRFENAVKISEINYNQAIELAYYGASVIHPKTIQPLKSKNISLFVNSFLNVNEQGTVVSNQQNELKNSCYIVKENQTLIHISSKDYSFIAEEHLKNIFEIFANFRLRINVMQNSAISFSACFDTKSDRMIEFYAQLSENFNIEKDEDCHLFTIYNNKKNEDLPNEFATKQILMTQEMGNTKQMVLK